MSAIKRQLGWIGLACCLARLAPVALASEPSVGEVRTSQLLEKLQNETLREVDLVDVDVVMRGGFQWANASGNGLMRLTGCKPSPAAQRSRPVVWPEGRGRLSGKSVTVVDALLVCSKPGREAGLARVTTMFDGQRMFMIIIREGQG